MFLSLLFFYSILFLDIFNPLLRLTLLSKDNNNKPLKYTILHYEPLSTSLIYPDPTPHAVNYWLRPKEVEQFIGLPTI